MDGIAQVQRLHRVLHYVEMDIQLAQRYVMMVQMITLVALQDALEMRPVGIVLVQLEGFLLVYPIAEMVIDVVQNYVMIVQLTFQLDGVALHLAVQLLLVSYALVEHSLHQMFVTQYVEMDLWLVWKIVMMVLKTEMAALQDVIQDHYLLGFALGDQI